MSPLLFAFPTCPYLERQKQSDERMQNAEISGGDQEAPRPAVCFLPGWNQAKTSKATPRRNEAMPCLT
jgi:hypothetical protein